MNGAWLIEAGETPDQTVVTLDIHAETDDRGEWLLRMTGRYVENKTAKLINAFSRDMCYQLRRLRAEGKNILQVEPFLEILIGIHEFFAEGHRPEELDPKSVQYPVYLAERNATGALLAYYETVMTASFEASI